MGLVVIRVEINGALLAWARERSQVPFDALVHKFPKLEAWESGETSPTLRQLEQFAAATHTPIGFLLLSDPPIVQIPIPDYRTIGNATVARPSPDLLDTLFECQQRQEWYQNFAVSNGEGPLAFVGSLTVGSDVITAAATIRTALGFDLGERGFSWGDAFARLAEQAELLGVLVMVNGVVGANTHRKLDPDEFRGFALADTYAPVVFINGADTKAAQIFTLAHELVHLWIGESALSDTTVATDSSVEIERWCNQVAAEVLVPLAAIRAEFDPTTGLTGELDRLARRFKVSTLVVLRRISDLGALSGADYQAAYRAELERVMALVAGRSSGGGNFYNTQPVRTSKRFTRAVLTSTLEGYTLYRDAFHMLGFKKLSTFNELAQRLEVG